MVHEGHCETFKYVISVWEVRENQIHKFSQTLFPKLHFGASLVINYSILLWHCCPDNLNIKFSYFKMKWMCKFIFFKTTTAYLFIFFACVPPEKWWHYFFLPNDPCIWSSSRALIKFEVGIQILILTLL